MQLKVMKYCLVALKLQEAKGHGLNKTNMGKIKHFDPSKHDSAVGLMTLPHLVSLQLEELRLSDSFYAGLNKAAPHTQVANYIAFPYSVLNSV